MDQEGRIYSAEDQAKAKIVCIDCSNQNQRSTLVGAEAISRAGNFTFEQFVIRIQPGTSAMVRVEFTDFEQTGTPIQFLDDFPKFKINAR